MGRISQIQIKESSEKLKTLYRKSNNSRIKLRIKCLLYTKEQKFKTQLILSTHLGIGITTLKTWLRQYTNEGLASYLVIKSGGNRESIITKEIHDKLSELLNSSTNSFRGYWDVQNWIKEEFNLEMKYNTVRTYLIRQFKTKIKTPRKSHYKKDEQVIEAFFKTSK